MGGRRLRCWTLSLSIAVRNSLAGDCRRWCGCSCNRLAAMAAAFAARLLPAPSTSSCMNSSAHICSPELPVFCPNLIALQMLGQGPRCPRSFTSLSWLISWFFNSCTDIKFIDRALVVLWSHISVSPGERCIHFRVKDTEFRLRLGFLYANDVIFFAMRLQRGLLEAPRKD